jgi:hypothetical protein
LVFERARVGPSRSPPLALHERACLFSGSTGDRTPDQWIKNPDKTGASSQAPEIAQDGSDDRERSEPIAGQSRGENDPIEIALADAIQKAAAAGRFEVLPSLVAELEARRKARFEVVDLGTERNKRRGR